MVLKPNAYLSIFLSTYPTYLPTPTCLPIYLSIYTDERETMSSRQEQQATIVSGSAVWLLRTAGDGNCKLLSANLLRSLMLLLPVDAA